MWKLTLDSPPSLVCCCWLLWLFVVVVVCLPTLLNYFCNDYTLCHVWSLLVVREWFDREFLKHLDPKNVFPLLCSWALFVCWNMTSTLSQAVYNSAFTFTSCLFRAWSAARGEDFGPSQVFSEHMPLVGTCGSSGLPGTGRSFESLILQSISFPSLSF